jgi:4-hydroxy-2-oxoglutarate aldolase
MATIDLSGVHIPTATPFDAEGELDLAALRSNLRHWAGQGIDGVVIGGSTGEAVFLDEAERRAVWQASAAEVGDELVITAGTGAESTRSTIGLCRMAAEAGAHATLVQPPAFYRGAMTPEALATHYRAVADASPIPVVLYQVPLKMSTLDWPTPLIAELAEHENIVGIKDSRGKIELVEEILGAANADFQVLVGSGALLLEALELGAVGGILGVANFATEGCVAIHTAFKAGDADAARAAQEGVTPLHNGIVGALGVPGVKAALDAIGLVGGAPRPPLHPLADDRRAEVHRLLGEAGLV